MTERYSGMLGVITERVDIHRDTGCSWEEAHAEQAKRAKRRLLAYRRRKNRTASEAPTSNVIEFRPRP